MLLLVFALCAAAASEAPGLEKIVVHTPWWPPGSEANAESIGVISGGRVFMTAIMEGAEWSTVEAAFEAELSDVSDIALAAGMATNLSGMVSCLVNAQTGKGARVREVLEASPDWVVPALTVAEMIGEYGGRFKFTLQCLGVTPDLQPTRTLQHGNRSRAVVAAGLMEIAVRAKTATEAVQEAALLATRCAGEEDGLALLLSCSAYVRLGVAGATDAAELQALLSATPVPPALTIVHAPTSDDAAEAPLLSLACTALASRPAAQAKTGVHGPDHSYAVISKQHGLVYASGIPVADANATGSFDSLGALLHLAGTDLSRVLSCRYYMSAVPAEGYPAALFAGFQRTFCVDNPPPPTRAEYVAVAPGAPEGTTLVSQCTAALPAPSE